MQLEVACHYLHNTNMSGAVFNSCVTQTECISWFYFLSEFGSLNSGNKPGQHKPFNCMMTAVCLYSTMADRMQCQISIKFQEPIREFCSFSSYQTCTLVSDNSESSVTFNHIYISLLLHTIIVLNCSLPTAACKRLVVVFQVRHTWTNVCCDTKLNCSENGSRGKLVALRNGVFVTSKDLEQ